MPRRPTTLDLKSFGTWLRDRRDDLKYTAQNMVDLLKSEGIKTSIPSLTRWERGETLPPIYEPTFLEAYSRILRTSPQRFLQESGLVTLLSSIEDYNESELVRMFRELSEDEQQMLFNMISGFVERKRK